MCVCVCLWWLILPPATCLQHHYLNKSNFAQNVSTEWLIWINEWHDNIFAFVWLTPNSLQNSEWWTCNTHQQEVLNFVFILFIFFFWCSTSQKAKWNRKWAREWQSKSFPKVMVWLTEVLFFFFGGSSALHQLCLTPSIKEDVWVEGHLLIVDKIKLL